MLMKKSLLVFYLFLLGLCPIIYAQDFSSVNSDGDTIYYNITSPNSVEVTYRGINCFYYLNTYKDTIKIPAYVFFNSQDYAVTSISRNAFYGCEIMSSIVLPSTIDSIGSGAFTGCYGLNSIYSYSHIPPVVLSEAFLVVRDTIDIFVPCGSDSLYRASNEWDDFTNIQPSLPITTNSLGLICKGESFFFVDTLINSEGLYYHNYTNNTGCDSIDCLYLRVVDVPDVPYFPTFQIIGNNLLISWQGNSSYYNIYRNDSIIGRSTTNNFLDTIIGSVNYCYKFSGVNIRSNIYCYSEASIDTCIQLVGLNDIIDNSTFVKIYPNPTSDQAVLEIEGLKSKAEVRIMDLVGKVIYNYTLNVDDRKLVLDVRGYEKGIYNVSVQNETINISKKLIIQ